MPATYVTAATLKASLGVGTLYDSYTWIEDTCQTAQDLINGFLWFDSAPVVGTALVSNVATVMIANPGLFTTGQTVTVAGGDDTKTATYANTPAINAAALMLAENIWTSRFSTQNGGVSVDGYSPSPFKMSNTLMASIRGLLAPYLSPNAMVG